jgi:CBS domain-containing protein
MTIAAILRGKGPQVHTLTRSQTILDASRELNDRKVGALVVLDDEGAPCGILSERDIVRLVAEHDVAGLALKVQDAMTRSIQFAQPEETVDAALGRMTDRRIRHLPVLSGGKLAGVVSIGDLVKKKIDDALAEADAVREFFTAQ